MIVNLECAECHFEFDTELGNLEMDKIGTLIYEIKPVCPRCKAFDKVLITKKGFEQLNKWFLKYLDHIAKKM
jgi:rubredoxin